MIQQNFHRVKDSIAQICQACGRNPNDITLVGVTKYSVLPDIKEALRAGLTHVGENRVQEAGVKFVALGDDYPHVIRHMIGPLQRNKVRQAVALFDCIQSVDNIKLLMAINTQARALNKVMDILIQVNTSGEFQKSGIAVNQVKALVAQVVMQSHIRLKGLMTMAPLTEDEGRIRQCFADLKKIQADLHQSFQDTAQISFDILSMGMSHDFKIALEEGANMLRIGRAIFHHE